VHGAAEEDVLRVGRRERGEVVGARQCCGAGVQGVPVDRVRPPQLPAERERRRAGVAGVDAVLVGARRRVAAGVEPIGGLLDASDADVVGQQRVDRAQPRQLRGVARADLAEGVDAGVGAAGDGQPDVGAQQRGQRALELSLDRALPGLRRPPGEAGAVVLECELEPQTSSRKTISVESLRRGPSLRIRV
jgi:hypothetical protein